MRQLIINMVHVSLFKRFYVINLFLPWIRMAKVAKSVKTHQQSINQPIVQIFFWLVDIHL